MKQESASRLSERQIAEFVENVEVEPREMIGEVALASSARFRFEAIDEIDGGEGAPSATSNGGVLKREVLDIRAKGNLATVS